MTQQEKQRLNRYWKASQLAVEHRPALSGRAAAKKRAKDGPIGVVTVRPGSWRTVAYQVGINKVITGPEKTVIERMKLR